MTGRIDDEKRILAAMMSGASAAKGALETALEKLSEGDFERQEYRAIFCAMRDLHQAGTPIDVATLGNHLSGTRNRESLVGALFSIDVDAKIIQNWRETLKRVLANSSRARLSQLGEVISRQAEADGSDPAEIAGGAMTVLADIAGRNRVEDSPQERARAFTEGMMDAARNGRMRPVIPMGFQRLDNILDGGLSYGTLVLAAARPSMGKTAWGLNVALHAVKQGKRVLVLSLEQTEEELRQRMVSAMSLVLHSEVRDPAKMSKEELERAVKAAQELETERLIIDGEPRNTGQIIAKIAYEKQTGGLDLVILDHLDLVRLPGKRNSNLAQELGECSAQLKDAAKKYGVCFLALHQLSRLPDTATDHRPKLSHLRNSGGLEQNADVVLLLYREKYYAKDASRTDAEIEVAKNRSGRAGETIRLSFRGEYMRFDEPDGAGQFCGQELSRRGQKAAQDISGMGV